MPYQEYVDRFRHSVFANLSKATIGGTMLAVHLFLNRETRDALAAYEKDYLHEAFQYTGGGLILTALGARSLFNSGMAVRIMSANPCKYSEVPVLSNILICPLGLVLGVSLA